MAFLVSLDGRKFRTWRRCLPIRHCAKKFPDDHRSAALATQPSAAVFASVKTRVVFLAALWITLANGQAFGHNAPPITNADLTSINSVQGFHDAGRLSFTINFVNANPIDNGYEFQLFFDTDFSRSTGYGRGYEVLIRGVQLAPQSQLDFVQTIGGSSSGGWGQSISTAFFDQLNSFDFQLSIPRIAPLPQTGSVRFAIEIYQWGALVDTVTGLSTTQAPFEDCNGNGLADSQEIADGLALDCNHNNSPDSCDLNSRIAQDCNNNGVPDFCDIESLLSEDCSRNLIPDECEPDCNNNNQADSCDLAMSISLDCDLNQMPDECQPLAKGRGPRYLEIHPSAGPNPVAIRIRGSQNDPAVSCLDGFVQADGSLGTVPIFQTPSSWCTVFVTDFSIVPNREYMVEIANTASVLESTIAKTWLWGDLNHDLDVSIGDVIYSISSAQGVIPKGFPSADLVPCEPDGEIDISDIIATINSLVGLFTHTQLCGLPCG